MLSCVLHPNANNRSLYLMFDFVHMVKTIRNNWLNQQDFNCTLLQAEWNFFATSHGKSSCDVLGGTVKIITPRTSLQRPKEHHILTPSDMFNLCNTTPSLSFIKLFYIPKYELVELSTVFAIR